MLGHIKTEPNNCLCHSNLVIRILGGLWAPPRRAYVSCVFHTVVGILEFSVQAEERSSCLGFISLDDDNPCGPMEKEVLFVF